MTSLIGPRKFGIGIYRPARNIVIMACVSALMVAKLRLMLSPVVLRSSNIAISAISSDSLSCKFSPDSR
jgi:hypothetical protein